MIQTMNPKKKKEYEAPGLTVVSFKAEHGFQASGRSMTFHLLAPGATPDDEYMETQRQSYGEANNESWF